MLYWVVIWSDSLLGIHCFSCRHPAGLRIGKLESHHSQLVSSKLGIPSQWIKQRIENLHSSAFFPEQNPDLPVAWNMEYPSREFGHAYTSKEYRNKGLAVMAMQNLIQCLHEDCSEIPIFTTVEEGTAGHNAIHKEGLVRCGVLACCV